MGSQASKTVVMESNSALRAEIGSANIVVYVSRSCPYCQTAMRDLTANGFDAKIVDANPSQRSVSEREIMVQWLFFSELFL